MSETLDSAIARLQLPGRTPLEAVSFEVIRQSFEGLADEEIALEIERLDALWSESGSCPASLQAVVNVALQARLSERLAAVVANSYFDLLADLQRSRSGPQGWEGLSLDQSRRLMSQVEVIYTLLADEAWSASQISRLLENLGSSVSVSFRPILALAKGLGLDLRLTSERIVEIDARDEERSLVIFPDGDLGTSIESLCGALRLMDPEFNLDVELSTLFGVGAATVPVNYLQLLHVTLIPLEDRDHPPSYLYEFTPRGEDSLEIMRRYETGTGNAALNLSKSVYSLDLAWARTKATPSARAVAALLSYLESLPYPTRREFARMLRALLHRYLRVKPPSGKIPAATAEVVENVIEFVKREGTGTGGVVEQRVMDACLVAYWAKQGRAWRPRGLGDPVNASNTARKKLGDVEFQNVERRKASVFEIHGGTLTAPYVRVHEESLRRCLRRRFADEWRHIDDSPGNWHVDVIFVAHRESSSGLPSSNIVNDISVSTAWISFSDCLDYVRSVLSDDEMVQAFDVYVHEILNRPTTEESTRRKYAQIAGLQLLES